MKNIFFYLIFIFPLYLIADNYSFNHNVASGDPTSNSVIIWTRITTDVDNEIYINWYVGLDTTRNSVVSSGTFVSGSYRDYTVKVDVENLESNTYYYYWFTFKDDTSQIGRTKTLPGSASNLNEINLCFLSCSNYARGYFDGYRHIAEKELDAVIHLGDYIYEYKHTLGVRDVLPDKELITIDDYRSRYSYYRLDKNLQMAHQNHPFILIWDDHEVVNNFYKSGHPRMKTKTDFDTRKESAAQAYFEWMPIRENKERLLYRTFDFGNLLKLIMLDTRGEGRDMVLSDWGLKEMDRKDRTIIGESQKRWFYNELESSDSDWNLISSQVIFSTLNLSFSPIFNKIFGKSKRLLDKWDGYPQEKKNVKDFIMNNSISNVVFYSGDLHIGSISEIYNNDSYIGTELSTPSLTSYNVDEAVSPITNFLIKNIFKNHTRRLKKSNPYLEYINLNDHGYIISKINKDEIVTDYMFSYDITLPDSDEYLGRRYIIKRTK